MDPTYPPKAQKWKDVSEVDWALVREHLANYVCKVIAHFNHVNPTAQVYGVVIERGQNWSLSIHLNTEAGLLEGPARFRPNTVGYEKYTDSQILAMLGRWYYQSWEFEMYEYGSPEGIRLTELHYELFERLSDQQIEAEINGERHSDVSALFLNACAEATALLEKSLELKVLNKTSDFQLRFYDANIHEWDTEVVMEAARAKVGG